MNKSFDPRVKLLIVMLLTGIIVFDTSLITQGLVTMLTLLTAVLFKVELFSLFKKLRHFLTLFLGLIVLQSFFRQGGEVYLHIGNVNLVSEEGVTLAAGYFFRVLVIIVSGAIIASSSMRSTLQGLVQLGLPYPLGLMTSIGVRFLPILMEEVKNAFLSMELRGIDVKHLPLRKRIDLIGRLFVPIVYSAITRAKRLSESIEMRGFVIGEKRSSYYRLKLKLSDILLLMLVFALGAVILLLTL